MLSYLAFISLGLPDTVIGVAWVILSLTEILLPQYYGKVYSYTQPAVLGEVAFMLWLLIKGAKPPAMAATALSAATA